MTRPIGKLLQSPLSSPDSLSTLIRRSPWPVRQGLLLGIDAEFVALAPAETEMREDGSAAVLRPARLGLARVSVVRGEGPRAGGACMDDYIRAVEPVYDYLTRYSGLRPGDLDPGVSAHHITTLKKAYLKLRYLVDAGCRFVGHGLKKDFRMINLVVPPEQIVDTVELFHLKRQRKISLRFLASYLLKVSPRNPGCGPLQKYRVSHLASDNFFTRRVLAVSCVSDDNGG